MAVEQENWLDNFKVQEFLTLETFKACINVSANRISTVETFETVWPLFYNVELTWQDLIQATTAEALLAQARIFHSCFIANKVN